VTIEKVPRKFSKQEKKEARCIKKREEKLKENVYAAVPCPP